MFLPSNLSFIRFDIPQALLLRSSILSSAQGTREVYKTIMICFYCGLDPLSQVSILFILKNILLNSAMNNLDGALEEETCQLIRNMIDLSTPSSRAKLMDTLFDISLTLSLDIRARFCYFVLKCLSSRFMSSYHDTKSLVHKIEALIFDSSTPRSNLYLPLALRYICVVSEISKDSSSTATFHEVYKLLKSAAGPSSLLQIANVLNCHLEVVEAGMRSILFSAPSSSCTIKETDFLSPGFLSTTITLAEIQSLTQIFCGIRSWSILGANSPSIQINRQHLLQTTLETARISSSLYSICRLHCIRLDQRLESTPVASQSHLRSELQKSLCLARHAFRFSVDSLLSVVDYEFSSTHFQVYKDINFPQ